MPELVLPRLAAAASVRAAGRVPAIDGRQQYGDGTGTGLLGRS